LHINNGRYFALADVSRMDWLVRTGVLDILRRHKVHPVIGDAVAKFRHELKVFQRFEIRTRLLGWDRKWWFMEHRFCRTGRVVGVVVLRCGFKRAAELLEPGVLLSSAGYADAPPVLPEWVNGFQEVSEQISEAIREEERAQGLR
jgi:hypothetical protein